MANTISILITAKDNASKAMKDVRSNFDAAASSSAAVAKGVAVAGAGIAAGIGLATKTAANFETQMGNISTLTNQNAKQTFEGLGKSILDMTKNIPKSAEDLGASAYDILSAGVTDSAEALKVLDASGRLATAGLSTTGEATNIMTSAINAFQIPASESGKIADILFKTVKNGKTTVSEMAQAFGASAPIVASAKISLEEFSAATAALTTTGLPASQAQNQLRASVVALQKPTDQMKVLLEKSGYASGEAALKQDGLVKVMQKVSEAAGGSIDSLGAAYGSVEALGAATSLTGNQNKAFVTTMKDMTEGSNAVDAAFEKQKATTNSSLTLLKNNVTQIGISVGSQFLPPLANAANFLSANLAPAIESTTNFLKNNKWVMILIAGVITALVIPAMVKWAVTTTTSAIKGVTAIGKFYASVVKTGARAAVMAYQYTVAFVKIAAKGVVWAAKMLAQGLLVSARFIAHAIAVGAAWTLQFVLMIARAVIAGIVMAAPIVLAGLAMIASAIAVGIAWVIAFLPVILIIAAVAAAAYLIINNWSAISGFFAKLWDGVLVVFKTVWDFIVKAASIYISVYVNAFKLVVNAIGAAIGFAKNAFSGMWNFIVGIGGKIGSFFGGVGDGIKNGISAGIEGAKNLAKGGINFIIDKVNGVIGGVNKVASKVPGVPTIPTIPKLATGGQVTEGGMAIVGEKGRELVDLPAGARVIPNKQTENIMANKATAGGGGKQFTFNVTAYSQFDLRQAMREAGYILAR